MDKFGTYQITLKYFPPGTGSGVETSDVSFEYVSGTSTTTGTETTPRDTGEESVRIGAAVMAIYRSYLSAIEYTEQARIATQNNYTQAVLGNLTLIENELESMNDNLDNVTRRSP